MITSDGIKNCIDHDQFDIIIYLVSDLRRFRLIISILIDVVFTEPIHPLTDLIVARRQYNVLEYAILLKKNDFVRIFVSVPIPRTLPKRPTVEEHLAVIRSSDTIVHESELHEEYKRFFKVSQSDEEIIE